MRVKARLAVVFVHFDNYVNGKHKLFRITVRSQQTFARPAAAYKYSNPLTL